MKFQIITVGKLKEKYLKDGIAEYLKRLQRYAVVEIVDARIPLSSRNPEMDTLTAGKPRVLILTKSDMADENATLASLRAEGAKGGELTVGGNLRVGNFEKKIAELYGIGVQVANANDTALADNDITLVAAGK